MGSGRPRPPMACTPLLLVVLLQKALDLADVAAPLAAAPLAVHRPNSFTLIADAHRKLLQWLRLAVVLQPEPHLHGCFLLAVLAGQGLL